MKATKTIKSILLCAVLGSATFQAFGWDNPGHMTVAGLAYDELNAAEQASLVALLKQHPGLELITRGFPDGTPDGRSLVMAAATWPDLAKNGTDLNYIDVGYEADSPAVTSVTFDHKMHKGYHFIDTPLWVGTGPAPKLPAIPNVNAVGVINVLVSQLKSGEADEAKAYDLGWLLHLVGDLHQPLHAVTGVSETYPKGDIGGNDVAIEGDKEGSINLHQYWDDVLGKTAKADKMTHHPRLDKDVLMAEQIMGEVQGLTLGPDANVVDPAAWAAESFKLARDDVYSMNLKVVDGDKGDALQADLDEAYNQMAVRDAKQQMRMAGHRLALLLKQIVH